MGLSTYSSNKLLDHVLRNTSWTAPTNTFLSLHTADPGLTGANEVSAGWYARQQMSWAAATTSGISTNTTETFSAVTGAGVTVTHIGIWDALTTGNFLYSIDITDITWAVGETPTFSSGNITLTIDTGDISDYLYPKLLDHLTGRAAYTSPTAYVSLYTTNPGVGDTGTEVSGTGYARETPTMAAAAGQAIDSSADTTFGPPTASWGTPAYYGIHDALTVGNLLVFGPITGVSAEIKSGDTVKIESGSLDQSWT